MSLDPRISTPNLSSCCGTREECSCELQQLIDDGEYEMAHAVAFDAGVSSQHVETLIHESERRATVFAMSVRAGLV